MKHTFLMAEELKNNLFFLSIILSGLLFNICSIYRITKKAAIYNEYRKIYQGLNHKQKIESKKKNPSAPKNCRLQDSINA